MTDTTKLVNPATVTMLRDFAKKSHAAQVAGVKASKILVLAAIKGRDTFENDVKAFYAEIRADVNGLAVAIGAERNKSGEAYTIPASIQAQVSQVLRAIKAGVDLGTESEPKGLGDIRNATSEAIEASEKAAAAQVPLTGDAAIRQPVLKALADAEAAVKAATGETLTALAAAVAHMAAEMLPILTKAEQSKADAASKADGKAEAIATVAAESAPVANTGMLPNGKAARRTRKAA
jgi:hypothetical protein